MARKQRRNSHLIGAERESVQTVAIYARVSTDEQAERETIKTQLDFLRRFVDLHELPVVGEYIDDGVSGRLLLKDRPEGRRLLDDAEAGRFGAVLVYNVKRMGRKLRVALNFHDALDALGVTIRSGTEPIDTATPTGKLLFHMLASFSEFDTDERAELLSLGRNRVARNGHYAGGPIPLGYDLNGENKLILSERLMPELGMSEGEFVADLFRRIANGETTLNGEAVRLTALGVAHYQRYPGKTDKPRTGPWSKATLQTIVHNPIYKGEGLRHSMYENAPCVVPAPALINAATWERAQAKLLENRRLSAKPGSNVYLLRGLIECANCGRAYVGFTSTKRSARTGEMVSRRRYRCGGNAGKLMPGGHRCEPSKILVADDYEEAVWHACREFILHPGDAFEEAKTRLRGKMTEAAGFADRRRALTTDLTAKEGERERVLTLYRRGKISDEEAERELDSIAKEAATLREELESLRSQTALIEAQETFLTESAALLDRLRDELADVERRNDVQRKQDIIRRYVRKITVESRRIGPRQLDADVRVYLRLKPEPIAVDAGTPWRSSQRSVSARQRSSRPETRKMTVSGLPRRIAS